MERDTFFSCGNYSTNTLFPLADFAPRDDEDVGIFLGVACLLALAGRLAPHALGASQTSALLAFAAAVRVIDGVHRGAAHGGADALPAATARFADVDQTMLFIGDFADRCPCGADDTAHFGRRELDVRVTGVLRDDLGVATGGAHDFAAIARLQLDTVDESAHRELAERQTIAELDGRLLGDDEFVAYFHLLRQNDVTLLAVAIHGDADECATEWIIFDARNLRGNVFLVEFEIDIAKGALVAAALMARRDAAMIVAAAAAFGAMGQGFGRLVAGEHVAVIERRHAASARGAWFVGSDAHTNKIKRD